MSLFGNTSPRGRVVRFFAVALVALLGMSPARADVIITSDFAYSNSNAFALFGPFSSQTNSASGAGNLFQTSSAFSSSFLGVAANSGLSAVSLVGPPNGVQSVIGTATNGGAASGLAESSGFSYNTGNIHLTPAGGVNTEYKYSLTESGFAAASGISSAEGFVGTSLGSSGAFTGGGFSPFFFSSSGVLLPGTNIFFETFGFGNSFLAGGNVGTATFVLTLTPIPEPGTVTVLGLGVLGLAGFGWVRRRRASVAA
jgi:hypothetical protein